ncbi:MAG: amidohydrolase family protein, partial [Candidatus Methanomethylophilaceae archaeon]|nr:amidohydrolase family protein [Candidatus Methanomethylophilaceae archaeon]
NIYTDCSALQGWLPSEPQQVFDRLRKVADEFPDRMVFGSDFPLYEERFSTLQFINLIREGDWGSDQAKEGLLGTNMARLLGLR